MFRLILVCFRGWDGLNVRPIAVRLWK